MGGARGDKLRARGDLHWARGDLAGNEAICLRVNLVLALVQLTRLWVLDLELDQAEQYACPSNCKGLFIYPGSSCTGILFFYMTFSLKSKPSQLNLIS